VKVDATAAVTYTFNDIDFVQANTGYTTVSAFNSMAAWAKVFNYKVPGITATTSGGRLILTSNRGASDDAALVLSQPVGVSNNLINLGMFSSTQLTAAGQNRDYTLDRNTSQLKLTTPLAAGDSLSAGTLSTRAYVQSKSLGATSTIATGGASLWLVVDGAAQVIQTAINGSTTITVSDQSNGRVRYTAGTNNIFGDSTNGAYIGAGDFAIIWDPNLQALGTWRVSQLDTTNYAWFEIERDLPVAQSATTLAKLGITFVRTTSYVQRVRIASGSNRTPQSLCDDINASLAWCDSYGLPQQLRPYQHQHVRQQRRHPGGRGRFRRLQAGLYPCNAGEQLGEPRLVRRVEQQRTGYPALQHRRHHRYLDGSGLHQLA
jgi:hypothetical protein